MEECPKPMAWADYIDGAAFEALDGEAQVNKVLEYTATVVITALGECSTRHKSLIKHRKELG